MGTDSWFKRQLIYVEDTLIRPTGKIQLTHGPNLMLTGTAHTTQIMMQLALHLQRNVKIKKTEKVHSSLKSASTNFLKLADEICKFSSQSQQIKSAIQER